MKFLTKFQEMIPISIVALAVFYVAYVCVIGFNDSLPADYVGYHEPRALDILGHGVVQDRSPGSFGEVEYPPLFHYFLAWGYGFMDHDLLAKTLRVLFYFGAFISAVTISYKLFGNWASAVTSILLVVSPAFFDRSFQPIPQAVDILLFPVVLYLVNKRNFLAPLLTLVPIWMHGLPAIIMYAPLMIWFILSKFDFKNWVSMGFGIMFALPVILMVLPGTLGIASSGLPNGTDSPQHEFFEKNPFQAIFYLGLVPFFVGAAMLLDLRSLLPKMGGVHHVLGASCLIGLGSCLVIIDRGLVMMIVPLAILGGFYVSQYIEKMRGILP